MPYNKIKIKTRRNVEVPVEAVAACRELYGRSTGFAAIRSGGNSGAAYTASPNLSNSRRAAEILSTVRLPRGAREVSLNTFKKSGHAVRQQLSNIGALAVEVKLHDGKLPMSYGRYLYEDVVGQLKAKGEEGILPTFVVCAKSLFFVYFLEKPFFFGKAKGKKKENALKYLEHIAEGISDTLNSACDGIHAEPVKLNGYIPLPGKMYCTYEREFDHSATGFKWVVTGAVIGKLEIPEGARRYEADILADACMQRMPESWREGKQEEKI